MWWREIVGIRDGVGSAAGSWFSNNLRVNVDNSATTIFWRDRWVGDVPFCDRFRRLFDLS